jgi:hypothetical protein
VPHLLRSLVPAGRAVGLALLDTSLRLNHVRRLTERLPRHATRFSRFLSDTEQHAQLLRCLNDDTLPLQVRIVGALIRLYALPVSRIVTVTTDRFHRDENGAYLTLDRHPVLLPPRLARLIEEQIARPRRYFVLDRPPELAKRYLFPGHPPNLPRSASSVCHLLRRHQLPVAPSRNTAMLEGATTLSPIVLSDLFGISTTTANAWSTYTQMNWEEFLTAQQISPIPRPQRHRSPDHLSPRRRPPCPSTLLPLRCRGWRGNRRLAA